MISIAFVVMIDGKGVNQTARQFLIKMQMNKSHKKGNGGQKISKKKAKQPRQQNFALISSDYLNSAVPLPVPNIKLARAAAFRQVDMLSKISASDPYQLPNINAHKPSVKTTIRHENAIQKKELSNLVHSQSPSKQLMMMTVGGIDPYN